MTSRARVLVITAFCVLPCAWLLALQNAPQQPPVFRGGVDIFQLEVSVLDRQRQPMRGLTAADFTVLEDGKPRPIVNFSEVVLPEKEGLMTESQEENAPDVVMARYADRRLFAIVMDDWGMPGSIREAALLQVPPPVQLASDAKSVAKTIVDSLGPSDFAAIVLTRDTRFFPDFTSNRSKLFGSINEFKPLPRDSAERMELEWLTRGHIGGLPALLDVTDYLAKLPQHRKSIIYVSIGQQVQFNGSLAGGRAIDLFNAAKSAGISISSIDPSGLTVGRRPDFLLTMAENTGGLAVINRNDFLKAVPQIFLENQSYYLLGYQRTGPPDGKFRQLSVRVNRPGVDVHARTGYFAPGKSDMVKPPPLPFDEATDDAIRAVTRDQGGRRLYTYAVARPGALTVATEISSAESAQAKWTQGGNVNVTVTRGGGVPVTTASGKIDAGARGALIEVPLDAAPQSSDAAPTPLHISVKVTSGSDSLDDGTETVSPGSLLGAPIFFRASSLPRAVMRPVAEFVFGRTERMHIEWPVIAAADERRVRILRRTGEAMSFQPPLAEGDAGGRQVLSTDFSLASFGASEYVIEIFAKSGSVADRRVAAFKVVQ